MSADTWNGLEAHMFGDGPDLANELLALILAGKKTATCWDAAEGLKGSEVGKSWAVKDGAGVVRCVLETTELTQRRFSDVDAAFAFGMGVDRLGMLKYGMPDLRDMWASDVRWLEHYGFSAFAAPNPASGLS